MKTLRLGGGVWLAALGACRQAPTVDAAHIAVDTAGVGSADPRPDAAPGLVPARCHPDKPGFSIDDGGAPEEPEIGDAILYGEGEVVGVVHRTPAGRVAGVAVIARDGGPSRVVDLAPTLGDAPPPRLVSRGKDVVVAAYSTPRAGAGAARQLTLYSLSPEAAAVPLATIDQARDDSFAFDLAWGDDHGIVVWDEAASAARGVVRAAVFSAEQRIGPSRDISPLESDAELPRVLRSGSGFVVAWIARSAEASSLEADSSAVEATGEVRSHGWLEMIALEERGAARGPARRLTPTSGHVTAYDVQPLGFGPKAPLLFVARDDGEEVDGSGGVLLRVRVTAEAVEPPVAFATDGLGRGAPTLIGGVAAVADREGQPPSLAWVGSHEHLRLLPLDLEGAPVAAPSAELAMDEARPLLWTASGRILVATPSDSAAQLRTFVCGR